MILDGGSLIGKAALVALDTRVILGALLGWSLVSRALKQWNNNKKAEDELVLNATTSSSLSGRTPHASNLETEVKSLRKSIQNLRADNLVLAAQVAQLHGGMYQRSSTSSAGQPKALNDAFEAAAAKLEGGLCYNTIERNTRAVVVDDERQLDEPRIQASTSIFYSSKQEIDQKKQNIAADVLLLQHENEELRLALEHLRLENAEMAERMLEVAFRGSEVATDDENLDINPSSSQLGELRNALILEAGGGAVTETEEEVLWLEVERKADDVSNVGSFIGGPTTPELAHEGGETSGSGRQRHIPAAAYLED
jgi:hypothetical protein